MAVKPDLWMPLYFGAYLTDTMHLTTEQHWAYLLLLMACWKRGGYLPDDDEQLGAIAKMSPSRWSKARSVIAPFWQITGRGWTQKRLGIELESARQRHQVALENGTKGGRPRKADDNPTDNQTDNPDETKTITKDEPKPNPDESSVPRPLPIALPGHGPKPEKPMGAAPPSPEFDEAWKHYPTRSGNNPKADALNAWNARIREGVPTTAMLAGLQRYVMWCEETDKIGTETVMQAVRFFGKSRPFEQDFALPKSNGGNGGSPWWSSNEGIQAKANELGIGSRSGESWNDLKSRVNAALESRA